MLDTQGFLPPFSSRLALASRPAQHKPDTIARARRSGRQRPKHSPGARAVDEAAMESRFPKSVE